MTVPRKEFAPGIPAERKTHPLPTAQDRLWTMSIQEHLARKAGPHWDLRLVDPATSMAHSWALPKSRLPDTAKPVLAIQTPTHTSHYALTFGDGQARKIGKGYGAGTVAIKHKEPVKLLSSSADRITFLRDGGDRYTLIRTNADKWLLKNTTTKQGSSSMTPYARGQVQAFKKLGMDVAPTGQPSHSATHLPLESNDADTPISQLTGMLNSLPRPVGANSRSADGHDSVEDRLNRQTSFTSPMTIPLNAAEGPSPIWSGFGT